MDRVATLISTHNCELSLFI